MPKSRIFNVANMPLNAIRENKILVKISEFTVLSLPVRQTTGLNLILSTPDKNISTELMENMIM